jgi:shikimate kinase
MSEICKKNIYLVGPMGAGKTSIGKQLARRLQLTFYDSDQVIEERTGADIPWIYELEGEAGFHQREIKVVAELVQLKNILLATGGSTVIVPENRVALATTGIVIYLKTSLDDQMERIKRSKKRPLVEHGEERRKLLRTIRATREPFYEELAQITYNTDNRQPRSVVADLLRILHKKYPEVY